MFSIKIKEVREVRENKAEENAPLPGSVVLEPDISTILTRSLDSLKAEQELRNWGKE